MRIDENDIWSANGAQLYVIDRDFNTGYGIKFKEKPTLNVISGLPLLETREEKSNTINQWLKYAEDNGFGRVMFTSLVSTVGEHKPHFHDMANRFLRTTITTADKIIIGWGDTGAKYPEMVDYVLGQFDKKFIEPFCMGVDSLLNPFTVDDIDEDIKIMVYPISKFQDPDYDPESED